MTWLKLSKFLISIWLLICCQSAFGIWFDATGQAVIHDGNKAIARQQATQEAIKQALMFAGASVKSVQHMANGLLQDDKFEVVSSGEVGNIELIDEIYHGDIVTVSVRVDIFPQSIACNASDYKKNVTTTWYQLRNRQQASVGNMYDFGKILAQQLQLGSRSSAKYSTISQLEPYYLAPDNSQLKSSAFNLAKKTHAQFVLFGEVTKFGVTSEQSSSLKFWEQAQNNRNLALAVSLVDGVSGELIFQDQLEFTAPWGFDLHQDINADNLTFWESDFGIASQKLLQDLNDKIDDSISCLPAYGRVINVASEQITINIGKHNGVKAGDKLTLFQVNQVYDDNNQAFKQFYLHPEKVLVKTVFANNAILISENGAPLANIQPNDFVARR
ncbi:flagellar assembly protein FlgT [Paraglaciecola aquimarina]|uniref:Flagellar assembly protein FlgT n=1 Tax=Paraglaciecola algarum TaxID=3050085 RepID=A0ABS9D6Y0_9ALTE|nr:flagella assembly protein FlgT [Paraglaciecola sp. G1-23]MCF2948165.1 flagellar assembly protein FlgT [Paraglaciecola sp. G1-23]